MRRSLLLTFSTLVFSLLSSCNRSQNEIVLYSSVETAELGTASGLFRTFVYIGTIASSAMIGVMFHNGVTDAGLHRIGAIMIAASVFVLFVTLADRGLHRTSSPARTSAVPAQRAS